MFERVSRKHLFFYALADFPLGVALIPVLVILQAFYATKIGIEIAAVGAVIAAARVVDLFTDPLMGYISDNTKTRWGRRRIWMVVATPLLMLAVYKVFMPTGDVDRWYLLFWTVLMWLGWTIFLIPFLSWGAELSPNYKERTRISSFRVAIHYLGSCLAFVPPMIAFFGFGYGGEEDAIMEITGWFILVTLPICTLLSVWIVPESKNYVMKKTSGYLDGLRIMWRNGPFKRLMLAFFLGHMGITTITSLSAFYARFVIGEPELAMVFLAEFFLFTVVSVPVWMSLSRRIGKHLAWIASLAMAFVAQPIHLFLGVGDVYLFAVPMGLLGFAQGAYVALPNAMKADVVDLDTLKSGSNRAAIFFSIWAMTFKIAAALSILLSSLTLSYFGFEPKDAAIGDASTDYLRYFYSLVPPVFFALAAWAVWRYPITEHRHARLRERLEARNARRAAAAELASVPGDPG